MSDPMSNSVWSEVNGTFTYRQTGADSALLKTSVYEVVETMFGLKLVAVSDSFIMPGKTYDISRPFIDKILSSWNSLPTNMGVLLAGRKGTGKSVIAKQVANSCSCPVIIVTGFVEGLASFIAGRPNQDICLFIDEFEKHYKLDNDSKKQDTADLLSLLDGTQQGSGKILTILTVNNTRNMEYMLDRPGRIRYHRDFQEISAADALLIIEDMLQYPEHKEDLLNTCQKIDGLTIDAVIALTTEVNLYNQPASDLVNDLNLSLLSTGYTLTYVQLDVERNIIPTSIFTREVDRLNPATFNKSNVDDNWYVDGSYYGEINSVMTNDTFILEVDEDNLGEFTKIDLQLQNLKENEKVRFLVKVSNRSYAGVSVNKYRHFLEGQVVS